MSTPNFLQLKYNGINIPSQPTSVAATAGDISYNSTTNQFSLYTTSSDVMLTQNALGTLTETTSSVLTLSGWTQATVGSPTITVKQASSTQSGYLSSSDWNHFNSSLLNPMTTAGDTLYEGVSSTQRLPIGTAGQVLTVVSGLPAWEAPSFNSPLTTAGDIIYENSTPTPARLPIGTSGQVLTVSGGLPSWQNPTSSVSVNARYTIASQVSHTGNIYNVTFGTQTFDSNSAYNTTTGVYTVPASSSGIYDIKANIYITYSYTNNEPLAVVININGTVYSENITNFPTTNAIVESFSVADIAHLNAGDTVSVSVIAVGSPSFNAATYQDFFSIIKIG